jgi:hypothetical protein
MLGLFLLGFVILIDVIVWVIMLSAIIQSVILLSVIACFTGPFENETSTDWKSFFKNLLKKSSKNGAQGSQTIII